MEPENNFINNQERLMKHPDVQRLLEFISLAESGFFLLEVSSLADARQILAIAQKEVPKQTGLPLDIVRYTPKTVPNYNPIDRPDVIRKKIGGPLQQWVDGIQIPQEGNGEKTRLFVVDGSEIGEKDRAALVAHFAFMNMLRDKVVGNKRGPTLVIIPARLEIEKDIGKYNDLMSCCSGRFHIKE